MAERSMFSSLLTRVLEFVGPRELPVGESYQDGFLRQGSPPPVSQTRWFLSDLEAAIISADSGNMKIPGRLARSLYRDGMIAGVFSTRCDGMVQLPKSFYGPDATLVTELSHDFDYVFPSSELALLARDGRCLGVGVAELVQVPGSLPVCKRLDPEFLQYRWAEDRWYYQSVHGTLPINPGDGRWILHCPGGAVQPWTHGLWQALARAYIAKEHAFFFRENYSSKLANAARVAYSPAGANDAARLSFFKQLAAWGINTVFDMPPGWEVKLLESNGRGYEVFQDTIKTANEEVIVTIAGQLVTTTGGSGFANSAIHSTIRSDLIQADADALAATINTQGIPCWANERFGAEAVDKMTCMSYDVTPPKDLQAEATAAMQMGNAVEKLNAILANEDMRVDVEKLARKYGVPMIQGKAPVVEDHQVPTKLSAIRGGKR
jgi:hypothetical protein